MKIFKSEDISQPKITGLIYGPPGSGKTTALSNMERNYDKPLLILDVDRSSDVLRGKPGAHILRLGLNMKAFKEAVDWLTNENGYKDYGLIALDNVSELESQMLTEYGRLGKNDGAPEQQHYNKVQYKLRDYVLRMRDLPVDVVFTAWETVKDFSYPDGTKVSTGYPKLSGQFTDVFCGLCNIVGHIEQNKDGKRGFRLTQSRQYYAKDQVFQRAGCDIQNFLTGK